MYLPFFLCDKCVSPVSLLQITRTFSFFLSFFFQVVEVSVDRNCPTMESLFQACRCLHGWLQLDSANVAVVHCQNGKVCYLVPKMFPPIFFLKKCLFLNQPSKGMHRIGSFLLFAVFPRSGQRHRGLRGKNKTKQNRKAHPHIHMQPKANNPTVRNMLHVLPFFLSLLLLLKNKQRRSQYSLNDVGATNPIFSTELERG